MTKTLQRKFIVTAMIAVTVLLLVLLGAINVFNVISSFRQSDELLEMLSRQEDFGPVPPLMGTGENGPHGFFQRRLNENDRMAALTFSVRFQGEELESVNTERIASLTAEEAEALGREALASGKTEGRLGERLFRIVQPAPERKTVVFLDVSSQRYDLLRVAALSALIGTFTWLAMLALVTALSRRAIRPIAENMERQRRFVTDAGHELKTPLAVILANLDAMELRGGENKYSRNIRSQTSRLSMLMQNLLTLARLDENTPAPDRTMLSLSDLTREAAETFRTPAELKKLRLETEIGEKVEVLGNRQQLQQLLSTLLDNAVKYCPEGGAIRVKLRQEDRAVLAIANTVGEERPPLDRLFDRFYRADSARSQKGGFGIGLSAAQAIVRQHKGEIGAAYQGDEIVFTVKL